MLTSRLVSWLSPQCSSVKVVLLLTSRLVSWLSPQCSSVKLVKSSIPAKSDIFLLIRFIAPMFEILEVKTESSNILS